MPFGKTFAPGGDPTGTQRQSEAGGAPPNPVQQAIQFLSLRIPRFAGARGVAPQALMQAPGAAGLPAPGMGGGMPGGGMNMDALLALLAQSRGGLTPRVGPGNEQPVPVPEMPPRGPMTLGQPPLGQANPGGLLDRLGRGGWEPGR